VADDKPSGAPTGREAEAALSNEQQVELAHFMGRLYEHARKLLAVDHNRWLQPEALELELARYAARREADRPKWLSEADADEPIRAAAVRAIEDFEDAGQVE
jgi:hypothetical protein